MNKTASIKSMLRVQAPLTKDGGKDCPKNAAKTIQISSCIGVELINDIVIFFLAILVAYVLGSCALFLESRLTNELWEAYVSQLVEGISEKISFATLKNKQMTISWIGGEALSTFENTCFFVIEFLSIYCNILFNIIAFYLALGKDIALSMLVAIFLSFVLLPFSLEDVQLFPL